MRLHLALVLGLLVSSPVFGDDDTPPEVKAQIKLHTTTLKTSKKADERRKAAEALGALGESGKLARRDLCQAMMDGTKSVRTAAADALKKVDEPMYKLATAIYINHDFGAIATAMRQGEGGEPLTPLVLRLANDTLTRITALASNRNPDIIELGRLASSYEDCLRALAEIARSDPGANRLIIGALRFQMPYEKRDYGGGVRATAVRCVAKMANVKQAVKPLLTIASADETNNRIAAIQLLANIADDDSKDSIKKTLEKHRFDNSPAVRQAVDSAMKKLEAGN